MGVLFDRGNTPTREQREPEPMPAVYVVLGVKKRGHKRGLVNIRLHTQAELSLVVATYNKKAEGNEARAVGDSTIAQL